MKRSIEVEDLIKLVESGLSSIEISKMYNIYKTTLLIIKINNSTNFTPPSV